MHNCFVETQEVKILGQMNRGWLIDKRELYEIPQIKKCVYLIYLFIYLGGHI